MYDVNLQPITSESNIPFKKVLLLSDGVTVTTGTLKGIDERGYTFNLTVSSVAIDGTIKPATRGIFKPTHYTILTITLQ